MSTIAFIQARMGSTRLPGKALMDIAGKPMIQRVYDRACMAKTVDNVVILVKQEEDQRLWEYCEQRNLPRFRCNAPHVLGEFVAAAQAFAAKVIVRLTGDCPLILPDLIDRCVQLRDLTHVQGVHYVSTVPAFPEGLDTEVFTLEALQWASRYASRQQEHVTLAMREHPRGCSRLDLPCPFGIRPFEYHWSVDEEADLAFPRLAYERFGEAVPTVEQLIDLWKEFRG